MADQQDFTEYDDSGGADPGFDASDPLYQAVQAVVQQELAPLAQGLALNEQTGQARDLVAEFPQLGEEEDARATVTAAQELAEQLGAPHLAGSPGLWRAAHLMRVGQEAIASGQPQQITADMIVNGNGGPGARCLPFNGGFVQNHKKDGE